jgi:hypothetical protein
MARPKLPQVIGDYRGLPSGQSPGRFRSSFALMPLQVRRRFVSSASGAAADARSAGIWPIDPNIFLASHSAGTKRFRRRHSFKSNSSPRTTGTRSIPKDIHFYLFIYIFKHIDSPSPASRLRSVPCGLKILTLYQCNKTSKGRQECKGANASCRGMLRSLPLGRAASVLGKVQSGTLRIVANAPATRSTSRSRSHPLTDRELQVSRPA